MGLPQVQTCCFLFDLKTGCIILGSLNALLSFILLCVMIVFVTEIDAIDIASEYPDQVEAQAAIAGLFAMCIILIIMFLLKFIFDIVFIWGVCSERATIIKAYMIMWIVFFLLSMFIFFLNSPHYSAGTICTEVFYIGNNVYTILITHSFYKQLNNREEV